MYRRTYISRIERSYNHGLKLSFIVDNGIYKKESFFLFIFHEKICYFNAYFPQRKSAEKTPLRVMKPTLASRLRYNRIQFERLGKRYYFSRYIGWIFLLVLPSLSLTFLDVKYVLALFSFALSFRSHAFHF